LPPAAYTSLITMVGDDASAEAANVDELTRQTRRNTRARRMGNSDRTGNVTLPW